VAGGTLITPDGVTFGEAMLRFSLPIGVPLTRATNLEVHVAGAEANVAVALSSLGRSVAWISRLPDNDLGRMVARDLAASAVDISHISWEDAGRLGGTYFVELGPRPKGVSVTYDRQGSAAAAMSTDDLPPQEMAWARLIHLTGVTPALSRSCREATEAAATVARDSESLLSVDINYRARLWSAKDARRGLERIVAGTDLVVCTAEDARDVSASKATPRTSARVWRTGWAAPTPWSRWSGWRRLLANTDAMCVEATPTHIVDRLGAGDAFTAGVIDGLLDGDIGEGLRRGSVLAAMALATQGDQIGVTRRELTQLLDRGGRRLSR